MNDEARARQVLAAAWGDHPQWADIRKNILDGSTSIHSDTTNLACSNAIRAMLAFNARPDGERVRVLSRDAVVVVTEAILREAREQGADSPVDYGDAEQLAKAAFGAMPLSPHQGDREAIARALYEHWVCEVELQGGEMAPWDRLGAKETWLSRADAVLALQAPLPTDEGRECICPKCGLRHGGGSSDDAA